ncbi:CND2 protein, partial [Upupa epops]|nr:CND2 protein [Upupa epops]
EGDVRTMCLYLSMNPGEYSYFSPRVLSMWAGPNHWHFRPAHRRTSPRAAAASWGARKRQAKKLFEINFEEDVDFEAHFRKTKAVLTLSKSILECQNVKNTTLPPDYSYDPKSILQLFLKPSVQYCRVAEPQGCLEQDEGIADYDYNNPGDTTNFCPVLQVSAPPSGSAQLPEPEEGGAGGGHPGHAEGDNGADITTYGEMQLLAEPQKVPRVAIEYAKVAKQMDVRRLKSSMWGLLASTQPAAAGAEVSRPEPRARPPRPARALQLSQRLLPSSARLPPTMATNLSVPLALACLLHLANEKSLKLESTEDLADILVK